VTDRGRWPLRAAAGASLLAGSWAALSRPDVQRADVRVGDAVRRAGTPSLDRAVSLTTDLGSVYAVVGIAGVLAATGRRRTAADVLCLGGATWAVAQAAKTRVRRQRPYEADGVRRLVRPPTGSSFPSGHAAVGAAVLSLLAARSRSRTGARLLAVLAAYVPLSRIYVGVHYPTDVVGGAGLGLLLSAVWRGPVAAIGRGAVTGGGVAARRGAPPVLRALLAGVAALRLRGRAVAVEPPDTARRVA
jgi:membrane-associated phospholipid phosphatase